MQTRSLSLRRVLTVSRARTFMKYFIPRAASKRQSNFVRGLPFPASVAAAFSACRPSGCRGFFFFFPPSPKDAGRFSKRRFSPPALVARPYPPDGACFVLARSSPFLAFIALAFSSRLRSREAFASRSSSRRRARRTRVRCARHRGTPLADAACGAAWRQRAPTRTRERHRAGAQRSGRDGGRPLWPCPPGTPMRAALPLR